MCRSWTIPKSSWIECRCELFGGSFAFVRLILSAFLGLFLELFAKEIVSLQNMDSNRLQKVARLIQKDMGVIFQTEAKKLFMGAMITPTKVRVSADLCEHICLGRSENRANFCLDRTK